MPAVMAKAAEIWSKREESEARFDSPEREQARAKLSDTLRSTDAKPSVMPCSLGHCRGAKEEDRRSTADRPAEEAAVRPSVTSAIR